MIYLDNAATSFPKPPEVMQAMASFLERAGATPAALVIVCRLKPGASYMTRAKRWLNSSTRQILCVSSSR